MKKHLVILSALACMGAMGSASAAPSKGLGIQAIRYDMAPKVGVAAKHFGFSAANPNKYHKKGYYNQRQRRKLWASNPHLRNKR